MAHLTLRVSDTEKLRLTTAARRSGKSTSQHLRSLLFPETAAPEPQHEDGLDHLLIAVAKLDQRLSALEDRASREY
jgi:hypothetical protein